MDALDNLLAAAPLLRQRGSLRLQHPKGLPVLLPTPPMPTEIQMLFTLLGEGWRIVLPPATEHEPTPALPPTTAILRRSTTHRRRRR